MSQLRTCHWVTLRCWNELQCHCLGPLVLLYLAVVAGPAVLVLPSLLQLHSPDLLHGQIFLVSSTNQGTLPPCLFSLLQVPASHYQRTEQDSSSCSPCL